MVGSYQCCFHAEVAACRHKTFNVQTYKKNTNMVNYTNKIPNS